VVLGMALALVLVLALALALALALVSVTTEEAATTIAVVLPEVKQYTIQPLDAPTWIEPWHPASATRPAKM
jgi:hypothetical protein